MLSQACKLVGVGVAAGLAAGCGGGSGGGGGGGGSRVLTTVAIIGNSIFTAVGQTSQLTAEARYSTGPPENVTASATWSSSNTAIATVTPGGLVTAAGSGNASITATYQGVTGTQGVSVSSPPVQSLTIDGNTILTSRSQTSQLTAAARLADGSTQNVTLTADWSVSNPAVATIVPGGLLTAQNNGVAEAVATFQGQRATRTVETRWADCQVGGTRFHSNGVSQTPLTALNGQGCQTCHAGGRSAARLDFTRAPADVYNAVLVLVRPRDVNNSRLAQFGQSAQGGHVQSSAVNACYPGAWCGDLIRRWITEGACPP